MGIVCLLMAGISFGVELLVVVVLLGGVLGGGWVWCVRLTVPLGPSTLNGVRVVSRGSLLFRHCRHQVEA